MFASKSKSKTLRWLLVGVLLAMLLVCAIALCACDTDYDYNADSADSSDEDAEDEFFLLFYFDENEEPIFWSEGDTLPSTDKDGYYFVGWFEEDGTQKIDVDNLSNNGLDKNYSLYAVYETMKSFVGVTFESKTVVWDGEAHKIEVEGAPSGASISYSISNERTAVGEYQITATIEKAGYYTSTLDATLTIQKKMCTVTFKQDGVDDELRVVEYGTRLLEIPTIAQKSGYVAEWDVLDFSNIEEDMVVCCQYTPIEYTISFHENICGYNADSLVDKVIDFTVESDNISLYTPTRVGYTFVGWFDSAEYVGDARGEIASGSVGDRVLYAKWELVEYSIQYQPDGYIAEMNWEKYATYTIESGLDRLMEPYYSDGREFVGWYTSEECEGVAIECISVGSCENLVLYAKSQPQS